MSAAALTPRQQEVLDWVKRFIEANGYAPTRVEIAKGVGFNSPNSAEEHLVALERKGALSLKRGISRGITLPKESARG